jgi:hypothetical protein
MSVKLGSCQGYEKNIGPKRNELVGGRKNSIMMGFMAYTP